MIAAALRPERGGTSHIVMWFRLLFGFHLIYSGMRFVLGIEVLSNVTQPLARDFVLSIDAMGIYAFVKLVELTVGILLVCNRLVALALIVELPITVTVFWLNTFIVAAPRQLFSGPQELFLNSILLVFYAGYYLPLLQWRAVERPLWRAGWADLGLPASSDALSQ